MAAIRWDDRYVLNVGNIDEQHKKLVDMINEFYEGISQKDSDVALKELLKGLIDYAEYHFSTEETFMKQHEFPFMIRHVGQHDAFRKHVGDCQRRIEFKELVISFEITNYLRTWLLDHILASDKDLCHFLQSKGIS